MLNNQGINIARRTVSKYREELEILPSSKRKLWFLNKNSIKMKFKLKYRRKINYMLKKKQKFEKTYWKNFISKVK